MNHNEWRPGQQPRSRLHTDHSTAYPGGGASKKSWRSQAQFCHQLDRPSATTSKRSDRKHKGINQDFDDSCIAVAVPCVAFFELPPPTQKRLRVNKTEACGGEDATMLVVALVYNQSCLSTGGSERSCVIPIGKKHWQYVRNNTWFPDRMQIRKCPPNRIELNSIH